MMMIHETETKQRRKKTMCYI